MKIVRIKLRAVLKKTCSEKNAFKVLRCVSEQSDALKSSECQRKKFCTGIKNFPTYSIRFKASFKSIKKKPFSENYTVVLPLKRLDKLTKT